MTRIIRLPAVRARTGLSRSAIYKAISHQTFPRQIALSSNGRSVGWLEDEIEAWVTARVEASRQSDDFKHISEVKPEVGRRGKS